MLVLRIIMVYSVSPPTDFHQPFHLRSLSLSFLNGLCPCRVARYPVFYGRPGLA